MTTADSKAPAWPAPPIKPDPAECCGRGCCPCIFDYYWDALERWEARVRQMGGRPEDLLTE
ncbi:MAG TPA: oxidoreductase-like domain-containing protein [Caulobacteraceae bacterium]|nr:oxidoreductase-like domain-containing protein [Caulobacteraceae bacterium]